MPLSDRQRAALPTLEWLLNPDTRAEGRTLAIAVATIRVAAQRPGRAIPYFDHFINRSGGRRSPIATAINMLTQRDVRLAPFTTLSDTALLLRVPRAIPDWYPDEDSLGTLSARQAGMRAGERFNIMMDSGGFSAQQLSEVIRETLTHTLQQIVADGVSVNQDTITRMRQQEMEEVRRMEEGRRMGRPREEDMISDEMADRFNDVNLAAAIHAIEPREVLKPKPAAKPKPQPKPRSAWERLLDDEEGEKD